MRLTRPRHAARVGVAILAACIVAACSPLAGGETGPSPSEVAFQTLVAERVAATLTAAAPPTATPLPSATPLPTAVPATEEPSATEPATVTPVPSLTPSPTARAVLAPTLGFYAITPENTPVTAVPTAVTRIKLPDDVRNILLVGSDTAGQEYRSDTLIVVSVSKSANTVTMLSIPRDLYVFIPKSKNQMGRINSVVNVAKGSAGGPIPLLEQTILYNLGIPIHYYARVDFASFQTIIDTLGGIDIPVTCAFQDWRLKDPALDPQDEDNWELFTLEAGVQHLDGSTALWYARARQRGRPGSGSDFDRSRRQQEVLRAIYHRARAENLLLRVPALYAQFQSSVETDMTLGDVLQFVPMALTLDDLNIRSYKISPPYTQGWTTPNDNASVQLPVADEFYNYVKRAMTAGGTNRAEQTPFSVEIWNGATWADAATLAAYRLRLEGLRVSIGTPDRTDYANTTIVDFTTSAKGSPIAQLKKLLHVGDGNVVAQPDANSPVQFRAILGADYNPCTYTVARPVTLTPTASAAAPTPTPGP